MAKISPQQAAAILLERRSARESLEVFASRVPVPGSPCEDTPEDALIPLIETEQADHHKLILREMQRCMETRHGRLMIMAPPGSAKALALDTPIPTPDGWKQMGELTIGDRVFDENGQICNVTWVSPIWVNRPVFKLTTDCGDEIIADHDHEWLVRLCGKPSQAKTGREAGNGKKFTPFKLKETHELCRRRSKRPMIKKALALELPEIPLPIDPYLLGVWLGDGNSTGMRITSSLEDQPWLRGELERLGYKTSDSSVPTLFGVLGVRGAFVSLNLINDPAHSTYGRKHVPEIFLRGSKEQRLALLQGLIDTDGTVCKTRGCTTFTNTNKELAQGVQELVRSLGVKAALTEGRAKLHGKDCGAVYRVIFYLENSARLPRKAILTRNQSRTPDTYIDVTPAGFANTVCIEVDSPSHLFLCGRSMTPTHNSTYASVVAPTWYLAREKNRRIILASYGDDLARKHGRRTRQLLRAPETIGLLQVELSAESRAVNEFSLSNGSEYIACGILGAVTGNRAHGLIIDDPVRGRKDADSEAVQKSTWEAYDDDLKTRLIPGGWIVIIQTRWNENDLCGKILPADWSGESGDIECRDGNVWRVVCLQAECQHPNSDPLGRAAGEMLWPEWFDERHWAQFRLNRRTWSSLYQQIPAPAEGILFRKDDMAVYEARDLPEDLRIIGASDCAVTPDGGDWTEFGIAGIAPDGALYLLDWWRGQVDASVWVERQIDMMARWSPLCWYSETGPIRRAIEMTLRRRMAQRGVNCRLEYLPSVDNKETNAQAAIALAGMGKIFWPRAAWVAELQRQVLVFPAGFPDDGVDALGLLGRGAAKLGGRRKPGQVAEQKEKLRLIRGGRDLSVVQNSTAWMGN